jgi:N-acetylneuraminic acid mutarotase
MNFRFLKAFVIAVSTLALLSVGTPARAQGIWRAKGVAPATAYGFAVGAVDGKVYKVGGVAIVNGYDTSTVLATVWAYDPRTDSWTEKAPMPTARAYLQVASLNGILYAVGGCLDYACGLGPLTTVEAYDPWTDTWTEKAPMTTARRGGFILASADGMLYAISGNQGTDCSETTAAEAYNPRTNVWTGLPPMLMDQIGAAGGAINGKIYVAGGGYCVSIITGVLTANTEAYDPGTNSWSWLASQPLAVVDAASGVINGKLYVVGGTTATGPTTDVLVFDPVGNRWRFATPMPEMLYAPQGAVVDGVLYVVGGVANTPPFSFVMFAFSPAWPFELF